MGVRFANAQGYTSPVPQRLSELFSAKSFEVLKDYHRSVNLNNICKYESTNVNSISDMPAKIIKQYYLYPMDGIGWENYYNNGENQSQTFNMSVQHKNDGEFLKLQVKISEQDYQRLLKGTDGAFQREIFTQWQELIKDMATSKLHLHLWNRMINRIITETNPNLKGSNVQVGSNTWNWGTEGLPLLLTPDKCINMMQQLKRALITRNIMTEADTPFMRVPPEFIDMVNKSDDARSLLHNSSSQTAKKLENWMVLGDMQGVMWRGVLLVPDYHMQTSPRGNYTIIAGTREHNLSKLFMTGVSMTPETTNGDKMVWLGMQAGIGSIVKRNDASAMFVVKFPS